MEKIFVITYNDVDDYNEYPHTPVAFTNEEDAIKALDEIFADADNQLDADWIREKSEKCFSIYLNGEYSCFHYCAEIHEVNLNR